jgi:GTPase
VLREIGAEVVPSRLLLNKIDRVSEADRAALRAKHPDAIPPLREFTGGRGRAA